jgi:hypothetical protein
MGQLLGDAIPLKMCSDNSKSQGIDAAAWLPNLPSRLNAASLNLTSSTAFNMGSTSRSNVAVSDPSVSD